MPGRGRKKKQGGIAMPFSLMINDAEVPVLRAVSNPLTPEACKKYSIDGMSNDIVHTNLHALALDVVSHDTSTLIYYFPTPQHLNAPLYSSTGLRMINEHPDKTEIQAVTYNGLGFKIHPYTFSLPGEIGCTAVANLGFFLLRELQGIRTRQLGILVLLDKDQFDETLELDIPVADDSILLFCRDHGSEVIAVATEVSDCPEYPECKNQHGVSCNERRARCRRKG